MLGASIVAFTIMHVAPGSPWNREGRQLNPALVERLNEELGLDQPLPMQYLAWLGHILQGDFGLTMSTDPQDANDYIIGSLGPTLALCGLAFGVALLLGIPLGLIAATRRGTLIGSVAAGVSLLGVALPAFAIGGFLLWIFPEPYQFPTGPFGPPPQTSEDILQMLLHQWILPVIALAGLPLAVIARSTKVNVLEVLHSDYVRTAHSKGLREEQVVRVHLLRNALVPLLTVAGTVLALLITGSIVVERVFDIDGLGNLYYWSIRGRDYTLLMGITVIYALVVAVINALVDVAYGIVDPRIRDGILAPSQAGSGG